METYPSVLSVRCNNNTNVADGIYASNFEQSYKQGSTHSGLDLQTSPTEGSEFGTNCNGSESSYMKFPSGFTLQSQFAFDAPTSMITLDEHNSQEIVWDFGLDSNEMDIENWNSW